MRGKGAFDFTECGLGGEGVEVHLISPYQG